VRAPLAAPDFAEPFEAWRVWRVLWKDGRYSLGSVVKPTLWPVRRSLQADCLHFPSLVAWLRRRPRHDAPEQGCECGIYATELDQLGQYLIEVFAGPAAGRVLGRVSLWGTVVECERGFRASSAYPSQIFVPRDAGGHSGRSAADLAAGLEPYGVPVEVLRARCADAPRALALG
jgi:hypothetical protein